MWSVFLGKQVNALRTSQASGSGIACRLGLALLALAFSAVTPAFAKTPQQIFAQDAPSIVVVTAYDASGQPAMLGSGVVIARGQVVTNCHVIKDAVSLRVKQNNTTYKATLHYADFDRDVCQLSVPELTAPPISMGDAKTLQPGAEVVAIGAPEGLELTISSGLVSSLRDFGNGTKIIQTSAAISPGSSGGGLFDDEGRLVGITAAYFKEGQNLNFALPANWIAQLPDHPAKVRTVETSTVDWMTTTVALEAKNDWSGLLDHARRWVHAQPQVGMGWFALGVAYGDLHQYAAAKNAYEQGITIDPTNVDAWYNLGNIYSALHQYAAAQSAYERAVKLDPTFEKAWSNLGVVYDALHQYAAAENAYEQGIKIDPTNVNTWYNLGNVYNALHQYAAAQSAYKQAIKLDPTFEKAWSNLGVVYGSSHKLAAAQSAYERAVKLDPTDVEAWFNLGNCYGALRQSAAAKSAFEHAIKLDPTDAQAWLSLGVIYSMEGNRDGANEAYQHLRKLDPAQADKLFNIAILPQDQH